MCVGVWAVTISAMSVSKGERGEKKEKRDHFFQCKTTGGLCQIITRPVLSRARDLSVFKNLQILLQHRKQKFHKKADRAEEEKQSNMRKELCNPGALARSREMELILFMWER